MSTLEALRPQLAELLPASEALLPDAVQLRRKLHLQPELGLNLPLTQEAVLQELNKLPLEIRTGGSISSIVADFDTGKPGPTIVLRGDMDALPMPEDTGLEYSSEVDNRMHACGHDAHTAMLVGAARLLVDSKDALCGRVRFMFQPGEEGPGGAAPMIDDGLLEGVDAAFAIHVAPNLFRGFVASRPGAVLAAADEFEIEIHGKGGHASTPHWAVDPIPVACEVVTALQTMITKTVDAFNPAVLTVAQMSAGTVNNVIPESAKMSGTLRTVDEKIRSDVWARISEVATGIASAHGCTAEVKIHDGYPVTVNNSGFLDFVETVIGASLGAGKYFEMPAPVMGAEDFSFVLQKVPGAMVFLGVCPPDEEDPFSAPSCHSNRMVLDEDSMASGIALHAAVAMSYLNGIDN